MTNRSVSIEPVVKTVRLASLFGDRAAQARRDEEPPIDRRRRRLPLAEQVKWFSEDFKRRMEGI